MVICLGRGAYLHMAQMMPMPFTVQIGFTVEVLAHPGSPGQNPEGRKTVVVVVIVLVTSQCIKLHISVTTQLLAAKASSF